MPTALADTVVVKFSFPLPSRLTVKDPASALDVALTIRALSLQMRSFPLPPSIPTAVTAGVAASPDFFLFGVLGLSAFFLFFDGLVWASDVPALSFEASRFEDALTAIMPAFVMISFPLPALIPTPVASAFVISSTADLFPDFPLHLSLPPPVIVSDWFDVSASITALAVTSIFPVLLIRSWPSPASIPVAVAFAATVPSAAVDGASAHARAMASTLIPPWFKTKSWPLPASMPVALASAIHSATS